MTILEQKFLVSPNTLEVDEYMKLIKTLMKERDAWIYNAKQLQAQVKKLEGDKNGK